MPSIAKIRFTHVLYEGGNKRYNDQTFVFDGHNGAIILENGGGKTVFIQTALQAMLPHTDLAGRKLRDTLLLENGPAHIAIEWILNDKPRRRYAVTCISLFLSGNSIDSYRYVYEYGEHDDHSIEQIPFVREYMGKLRPADKGEIQEYYSSMTQRFPLTARQFATIREYKAYLEENYHIIASEWEAIVKINGTEGGIEAFFDDCKTTSQLFDRLLIPTVERVMEGFEQDGFAKMFEVHREGFKRYKELKEQIEENRLILQELGQYATLYEKLHQTQEQYNEARREARAYRQLAITEYDGQRLEQDRLAERLAKWQEQQQSLQLKLKSLEIAKAEAERDTADVALSQLQEEVDGLHERLEQAERTYYSWQYAEWRDKREQAVAKLAQLRQQLDRLEQSEEEQQLEERWERNGGELRSVYAAQEEVLDQERQQWESAVQSGEQEQQEKRQQLERLDIETRKWELEQQAKTTKLESKREQQLKLARSILANPALETVEAMMPVWAERQQHLEEARIAGGRRTKAMISERAETQERVRHMAGLMREVEREQIELEQQQRQLQLEHESLLRELAGLRPNWDRLSSVYDREASITEQLDEGITRRKDRLEQARRKERIASRYLDDHEDQDVFFADTVIERVIHSWGRQLSLLQSGVEYMRGLAPEERERADDQLWAVTLVTTDAEKTLLQQKLASQDDEFAYPIRVLSASEAAALVQGRTEAGSGHWVVPAHWSANMETEAFQSWKQGLRQHADLVEQERLACEQDLHRWERVQAQFRGFVERYPLSHHQMLEEQLRGVRERLVQLNQEQRQAEARIRQLEEELEHTRAELTQMQEEIHHLDTWLRDGQAYMLLGTEIRQLERELDPLREQLTGLGRQKRTVLYQLERVQEELDSGRSELQDTKMRLHVLKNDDLYRVAQQFTYVVSERSLTELKEEHKALALEREGILKERRQLEQDIRREQERESEAMEGMQRLEREYPALDRQLNLPMELEAQKLALWGRIEQYRVEMRQLDQQLQRQRDQLQTIVGSIDTLRRQFQVSFPEAVPIHYEGNLSELAAELQQEERQLAQEREEWQKRHDYVERQLDELGRVLQLWDKHALVHRLDDETLRKVPLEEDRQTEFTYARLAMSERSIADLRTRQQAMGQEQERVRRGMTRFKDFCVTHVRDVKLRQMAIQGVELKDTYAEVMEFRQAMDTRIQKAIHIMMETIQTYDRDLQEFIHRIHTHLKQIVQELKELPRKTRVRMEDGWREIYSFSIPEWDDQDGKDRIREHIEWMIGQLESMSQRIDPRHDHGHGQDGQDGQDGGRGGSVGNDGLDGYGRDGQAGEPARGHHESQGHGMQPEVRKHLEKWLDSRTLLQVVLKGETMKVSCRKVTNNHQVTRATYSWEQSNRWSGGEKWSKNMTLFLGVLNYVAERRQYIRANMKLHRTVILDNPFGKASSDHVLSPVFFIAEQLGFQMIALTAHVEGKFLQDYFPIVHSCRLRQTADPGKQVIESTMEVRQAYFRDHAPETLDRIDSRVDQLTLF